MLETFLQLIEKLIKFREVRNENRRLYFDRYVRPTYEEAESIYNDYSQLLRELRGKIERATKTRPIVEFLEKRRFDYRSSREAMRAILDCRQEHLMRRFELGIWGLLRGSLSGLHESHFTVSPVSARREHTVLDLIERMRGLEDISAHRPRLLGAVDVQIRGIDTAWSEVCAGYASFLTETLPNLAREKILAERRERRKVTKHGDLNPPLPPT